VNRLDFKWLLLIIYALIIALFLVDWGQVDVQVGKLVYLLGPLTALVAGGFTLKQIGLEGPRAFVLKIIIAALGLWLLGEAVTLYYSIIQIEPYPSIIDVFFLTGYVTFSLAVLFEIRLFKLDLRKLDSSVRLLLAGSFLVLFGIVVYFGIMSYSPEESFIINFVTLSWSLGDLLMGGLGLVLLAMVWEYRKGAVKSIWLWFVFAAFTNLVADIIYNINPEAVFEGSSLTTFLDVMWVGAYVLFAGYFMQLLKETKKIEAKLLNK